MAIGGGPDDARGARAQRIAPRAPLGLEPALVGRMPELATLHRAHAEVQGGRSQTIGVRGESGVGKSRLVREFATDCERQHTRVLSTRCAERLAGPLVPIVRLLRHAAGHESVGAATKRRCHAQIAELHSVERPDDSDIRKGVLFLELTDLIQEVAAGRPTVIVVDDVQWADPLSGEFIEFLADELADDPGTAQILLVLTERSNEPEPSIGLRHPWITLHRFDRHTIRLFVRALGLSNPDPILLDELQGATGGNALHLLELVRHLHDEELLRERGGAVAPAEPVSTMVSMGLLDTIERRLDGLADPAREVAVAIAVADDEVTGELVAEMLERPLEEIALHVADLVAAGVIARDGQTLRYEHPMYQHVLERAAPADHRATLHARAAVSLLAQAADEDVLLRLARHLTAAGPSPSIPEVAASQVITDAARRSFALGAWEDALRYYLEALRRTSVDERSRGWLHYEAGRSAELSYRWESADEHYRAALTIAGEIDDVELAAWASIYQLHAGTVGGQRVLDDRVDTESVQRLVEELTVERGASAIVARTQFSQTLAARSDLATAGRLAQEAIAMAEDAGDHRSLVKAEMTAGLAASFGLDVTKAAAHYRRGARVADRIGDTLRHGHALTRIALLELSTGDLDQAQATSLAAWEANAANRQWSDMALLGAVMAQISLLRGEFTEVETWARESEHYLELSDYPFVPGVLYPVLAVARALQGDNERAEQVLERLSNRTGRSHRPARSAVERWLDTSPNAAPLGWSGDPQLPTLARLLEAAEAETDPTAAGALLAALESIPDSAVRLALGSVLTVPNATRRLRAIAAGRDAAPETPSDDHRWREIGARLLWCLDRVRITPDTDRSEALVRLTEAWREAHDIGAVAVMRLAEAEAHRIAPEHVLGQGDAIPATRVVMFVDMAGSTAIAVESDQLFIELMDRELEIVRRRTAQWGGSEFGTAGDAILASFDTAECAIACALAIHADVDASDEDALGLKIGIAAGPLLERNGDLFGRVVNLAARLSDAADAGEVITLPEIAADVARPLETRSRGAASLKGFGEPIELVQVLPAEPTTSDPTLVQGDS